MIQERHRIRLGFDIGPRPSGPGRYLGAIVAALDPDEFDVVVFGAPVEHARWPHVRYVGRKQPARFQPPPVSDLITEIDRNQDSPQTSKRPRWRMPLPRTCALWAGFCRTAWQLSRQIRAEQIDLFHAQNTGCEESPVAAWHARGPHVLGTFHVDTTYDLVEGHNHLRYRLPESYSCRCLHTAIAVSEATRQYWIRRAGIPDDRIITIHNGIDPDHVCRRISRQEARRRLGIPNDGRLILGAAGRLNVAKGFTHLIDAMKFLAQHSPGVLLVIAGGGPLEHELAARIASSGLQNYVSLAGHVENVELLYDALDIFVLSSICDAMPFALLEAMAHELPTIGTSVGGVPEVIVSGTTGFLAPPADSVALARGIVSLLASAELRESMGRAGRDRIVRSFNKADMVRKTLEVYRHTQNPDSPDRQLHKRHLQRNGMSEANRSPELPTAGVSHT